MINTIEDAVEKLKEEFQSWKKQELVDFVFENICCFCKEEEIVDWVINLGWSVDENVFKNEGVVPCGTKKEARQLACIEMLKKENSGLKAKNKSLEFDINALHVATQKQRNII